MFEPINLNKMIKGSIATIILASLVLNGYSQDTTKRRTIDITSTFKPVLREAAKVNFNAAPPVADPNPPALTYNIPAENLLFTYQPAELKPVALDADTSADWGYSNFIKAGVGTVHLPYLKAGFSFGDKENTFYNIYASHVSSKGDLKHQKNSATSVGAGVTYKTPNNLEWTGGLGFKSDNYFLYGAPDSLKDLLPKKDFEQFFQTIEGRLSLRNIVPTDFGLTYNPSVRISYFKDNHLEKGSEANTVFDLPVSKRFGDFNAFNLGITADLTNYRLNRLTKITDNNNIIQIKPAFSFKNPNFYLHAGLTPSWDNGSFHLLPNLMGDITTNDQRFTFQVGYIGYFNKGSYQRFASINPWLAAPDSLQNARVYEGYAGFKGSIGNHLSYSAKVGIQQHHNAQLFVNNYMNDKHNFLMVYEPKLNIFQTHLEAAYTVGEKFSAKGTFDWYRFSKIEREEKAWGLVPLELSAQLRWQLAKDLWFRSDLWLFDGAQYRRPDGAYKGEGAFDLNAGAEFRITKNVNTWLQMNNLLNNRYERWNRYEAFGFNILGGIVYNFNQQ